MSFGVRTPFSSMQSATAIEGELILRLSHSPFSSGRRRAARKRGTEAQRLLHELAPLRRASAQRTALFVHMRRSRVSAQGAVFRLLHDGYWINFRALTAISDRRSAIRGTEAMLIADR